MGYKLAPGGHGYELAYGSAKVVDYLLSFGPSLSEAWESIAQHEQSELVTPLLEFLTSDNMWKRGVRIVGDAKIGPSRAPTISFVVIGENPLKSKDVVEVFDKTGKVRSFCPYVCNFDHHRIVDWYSLWPFLCLQVSERFAEHRHQ
jgi:hypothetical protein